MNAQRALAWRLAVVAVLIVAIVAVAHMKQRPSSDTHTAGSTAAATGVPRMLELGSVSCIPCKMMKPVMEELKKEYGSNLKVDFIDVWEKPDEGRRYGIESTPTQILYDAQGNEITRHVGFWPKEEIVAAFREHGVELKQR